MHNAVTDINDILVVGGGDIGLLVGLSIRKLNPEIDVSVVDDFGQDPPEVGKSTYWDITTVLHSFLDIPHHRFISEVKPIWKGSVYFRDWCGCEPFHYTFDEDHRFPDLYTPNSVEHYYHQYDEINSDSRFQTVNERMAEEGKSALYFDPAEGHVFYDSYAYQLDLNRFNSFLRELCEERGVTLVDDRITAVEADGDYVEAVRSDERRYEADLYVDASGFNRMIKRELDDTFRAFDIPLDSAFNAKVERALSDVEAATVIESGDFGWFWQIDTYEFRDMGYVFDSDFVSDDDAAAEFAEHCGSGVSADDLTRHEFNSGYYQMPWQGNCVTIGNAEGFVEPIQSTGLTANAHAGIELAHTISSQGGMCERGREAYNKSVHHLWESIYDFVCVHYHYADGPNEFWETMQSIPLSTRVQTLIESFNDRGYDAVLEPLANVDDVNEPTVFEPVHFYRIMRGMGAESEFYEENSFTVSDDVKVEVAESYDSMERKADQLLGLEEVYKGILPEVTGTIM